MEKIKGKFIYEKKKFQSEIRIWEIVYWWIIRCLIIYAIIRVEDPFQKVLFSLHLSSTFIVDIVHMLFPRGSFFNMLSYHVQSFMAYSVFLGTFLGSYIFLYKQFPKYDLFLHLVSGVTVVIIGYYLAIALIDANSKKHNQLISFFGFSFSGLLAAVWEMAEFFGDYFTGSDCQGYDWNVSEDFFVYKIIGKGANLVEQHPLYDTMFDMIFAMVSTVFAAIILYIVLEHKRKKAEKNKNIEAEKEPVKV